MKNTKSIKPAKKLSEVSLFQDIRELIVSARRTVVRNVNTIQVVMNFEIGRRIVQHEQQGENRAEYGKELLKLLSTRLEEEFGSGFSERNLRNMRQFYLSYRNVTNQIWQTVSAKFEKNESLIPSLQKLQTPSAELIKKGKWHEIFTLSWSHYVFLISIKDESERNFYEIEDKEQGWSLRELERQFNSGLYERLALSRDKKGVKKLAREGQVIAKPEDLLKEPYVLEFLGLDEKGGYSETDREYRLYLPSKEELKRKLLDWIRDAEEIR